MHAIYSLEIEFGILIFVIYAQFLRYNKILFYLKKNLTRVIDIKILLPIVIVFTSDKIKSLVFVLIFLYDASMLQKALFTDTKKMLQKALWSYECP